MKKINILSSFVIFLFIILLSFGCKSKIENIPMGYRYLGYFYQNYDLTLFKEKYNKLNMKLLKLTEIARILGLNNNFKQIKNNLLKLLEIASILELNKNDLNLAKSHLEYNEFEMCYDTLITQMYEYDIKINKDDYELISEIGKSLNLDINSYSFMLELVK